MSLRLLKSLFLQAGHALERESRQPIVPTIFLPWEKVDFSSRPPHGCRQQSAFIPFSQFLGHFVYSPPPDKSSLAWCQGQRHFCSQMVREKSQGTVGLELPRSLHNYEFRVIGAARNQPDAPMPRVFQTGFCLGAEHSNPIFKQEPGLSGFSGKKYFKNVPSASWTDR